MHGSLENLTAVHLGFQNFMHGSPAENLAAVHLGFQNFMHGSPAENLAAVHLGFFRFQIRQPRKSNCHAFRFFKLYARLPCMQTRP